LEVSPAGADRLTSCPSGARIGGCCHRVASLAWNRAGLATSGSGRSPTGRSGANPAHSRTGRGGGAASALLRRRNGQRIAYAS
jgi:hypothetical protein